MKKLVAFLAVAIGAIIAPSCEKEIIKEVIVTDTLVVRDTVTITDTVLDLSCGLLAYYPFNGNFQDESGNGHHASSMNGAHLTSDYHGNASRSAGFDGINDYLFVENGKPLRSDTITISAQVYANNWSEVMSILALHDFTDGSAFHYNLVQSFAGTRELNFAVGDPAYPCEGLQQYDPFISVKSSTQVESGRWYHLLASFSNGEQLFYIDGVLVGHSTQTFKNVRDCGDVSLVIGAWWQNSLFPFNGKIDEIRIYSRLLNKCEIKAIGLNPEH